MVLILPKLIARNQSLVLRVATVLVELDYHSQNAPLGHTIPR